MKSLRDLLLIGGLGGLAYGLYEGVAAWPPLAWIAGGAAAASVAIGWRWIEVKRERDHKREYIRKRGE